MMVDRVCLATRKTLGALIAKYKDMGSFHYDTYSHLYNTLVAPIMDYSSCIWGFKHHKCLENVQNNAILWVGRHFPIASLVGDIEWVPAEYRHIYNLIKWWLKISSHDTNRLPVSKCILTWSMELASKGVRNWCWQALVYLQLPSMLINQGQYTACSSTLNFINPRR